MKQQKVLVTGSDGNVGKECVTWFQHEGFHVTPLNRDTIKLSNWKATNQWVKLRDPFDLVVMTHGIQKKYTTEEFSFESWKYIVEQNLETATSLTAALLKNRKVNPGGLIVYFSSIQATNPKEGRGLYAIAKAGLEALVKIVAVEQQKYAIRAIGLRLGQMTHTMKNIQFTQEQIEYLQSRCLSQWPSASQTAKFILDIYEQPSMTGCIITMDSGHTLNIW